jgi:hypothetical protein
VPKNAGLTDDNTSFGERRVGRAMQARDDNQQGEYLSFHSWCLLRSRCLLFNHPTEFLFSKNTTFLHIAKSDSTRNQSVFLRSVWPERRLEGAGLGFAGVGRRESFDFL